MTHYVMRKKLKNDEMPWERVTNEVGTCKEVESPQLPAPVPVRQSAGTTNAPRAEIKVVAPETGEKAAVITVSGNFGRGDNILFFDAVEKIHSATVYLGSPGRDASASVGIGEIIRERGFRTAVLNNGKCFSGCALAWLGGTKRYLGGFAEIGFHGPYVKKKVEISESLTFWATETTTRGRGIVADYVTGELGLTKDAADYVMEAPPQKVNYLMDEDCEKYGIALTRMNIPWYDPLP